MIVSGDTMNKCMGGEKGVPLAFATNGSSSDLSVLKTMEIIATQKGKFPEQFFFLRDYLIGIQRGIPT